MRGRLPGPREQLLRVERLGFFARPRRRQQELVRRLQRPTLAAAGLAGGKVPLDRAGRLAVDFSEGEVEQLLPRLFAVHWIASDSVTPRRASDACSRFSPAATRDFTVLRGVSVASAISGKVMSA